MVINFLVKLLIFSSLFPPLLMSIALFIPATPKTSTLFYSAKIDKDYLLKKTASPRLIMVGGSNLSFGINSRQIENSLKVHPINTGLHGSLGLKYMLDATIDYVKTNDLVIIVPEYNQFYGNYAYGEDGEPLLRIACDLDSSTFKKLSIKQWLNMIQFLPKFTLSKLTWNEYVLKTSHQLNAYERNSFNQYGDVDVHWRPDWDREKVVVSPYGKMPGEFNDDIVEDLVNFRQQAEDKGASVYISFPGYQEASFANTKDEIIEIENKLKQKDFTILGTPERYRMPDSLIFDTPYHLTKEGADLRTQRLIEDIKSSKNVNIN